MEKVKNEITKKVQNQIIDMFKASEEFNAYKKAYDVKKKHLQEDIIKSFIKDKRDVGVVNNGDKQIRVKLVTPKTVEWNPDELRKILPKKYHSEIIEKKYTIDDMDGLKDYLKSCGVDPKKFMSYIHVDEFVNNTGIEFITEKGIVNQEDLEKCCSVLEKASYLKLTEQDAANEKGD